MSANTLGSAGSFESVRRQAFVTEAFYQATDKNYDYLLFSIDEELAVSDTTELTSLHMASMGRLTFEKFQLRYTAGLPLAQLRGELTGVIEAYERYQKALEAYEEIPQVAPLGFEDIGDYERALQLVSLCYLLHRRDLLPRLRALLDPGYAGEDTVYEDLMAFDVAGRADIDEWYHAEPYSTLVNAMYLDKAEASAELKAYCDGWYKCFEVVPWHNSHTRIEGSEGDYFGYWAFEAGAVAFLYALDDNAIDHMVYPRELVAWAREHKALSEEDEKGQVRLRCEGGQPCPQAGFWSTPAKANSRRSFKAGELMPEFKESTWGATVWYWDSAQP
jgi:Domain of unknown function (DUF1911)